MSMGYTVPKEWDTLGEEERGVGSLVAFERGSRGSVPWELWGV